jgi:hypothetical protein
MTRRPIRTVIRKPRRVPHQFFHHTFGHAPVGVCDPRRIASNPTRNGLPPMAARWWCCWTAKSR